MAFFGGFHVQRFSPDGERLGTVVTPGASQTTCCWFGGPDLDTRYIATARDPRTATGSDDEPNAGALFAADLDGVGRSTNHFGG